MKKKLFRDEYLVNPNCTHYEIDPDDTPVPDEYDNYGCDCDIHSPPPPAKVVYPRPVNPYYRGPAPFINAPFVFPAPPPPPHACRHPMPPPPPPMPRGERKPIEPDIEDPIMGEYLKPEKHYVQWLIKQLELYPRLNDSCVVQGLWTFCKDLHIRNPHACINAPAKWNQDRLESSVVFTDHCDKELGRITLYKLKTGETGLELSIGDGKSLGLRDIEGGVISHAPTPEDIDPNEIATVGWVRDALLDLLTEITDSEPTEGSDKFVNSGDIYTWVTNLFQRKLTFDDTPTDGSTNPVTSDGIYDAIEAVRVTLDPTVTEESQNGVTSAGIYDFVTDAISDIQFPETTLPIASKTQKGIMQVGNYLSVSQGIVSVDTTTLGNALNISSENSSSLGSFAGLVAAFPLGGINDYMPSVNSIGVGQIVTGNKIGTTVSYSKYGTSEDATAVEIVSANAENSNGTLNTITACYSQDPAAKYQVTALNSNIKYRCVVAPTIVQTTMGNGNSRPGVRVTAGLFAVIVSKYPVVISAFVAGSSVGSHTSTVGEIYSASNLYYIWHSSAIGGEQTYVGIPFEANKQFICLEASSCMIEVGNGLHVTSAVPGMFQLVE